MILPMSCRDWGGATCADAYSTCVCFLRRRGSARLSVWHSKSRWLSIPMQLFVSVLLLVLSGAGFVQLTAAKLECLNDRTSAYGAGRISLDPADVDLRQFSKEKVLKSLPQQV